MSLLKFCSFAGLQLWLRLLWVDDKFSKPFKSYLGEYAVYCFISSMIEESKYCTDVVKKNVAKNM